jgi:uncharacterized protein (TIGR02246 family)
MTQPMHAATHQLGRSALVRTSLLAVACALALPAAGAAQERPSTRRIRGSGVPVGKQIGQRAADTTARGACRCDTAAVAVVDTAAMERALRERLTAELEARTREERTRREQAMRRLVDSVNTAYVDAVRRRDVDAATALYAPEAVLHAPRQRPIDGREAIRARFAAWLPGASLQDAQVTTERVLGDDEQVVATGRYTYAVRDGRRARSDRGTWLLAMRRQADGSWRIVRDVSDSQPAAEPAGG